MNRELWTYLTTVQKPVVLYGTGNGADKILDQLIARNIPVSGVFASSGFVRNRTFRSFPVESYEGLRARLGLRVSAAGGAGQENGQCGGAGTSACGGADGSSVGSGAAADVCGDRGGSADKSALASGAAGEAGAGQENGQCGGAGTSACGGADGSSVGSGAASGICGDRDGSAENGDSAGGAGQENGQCGGAGTSACGGADGSSVGSGAAPEKDMIVLVCFGTALPDVLSNIDRIALDCEVYAPDVPVYGENLFDESFFREHEAELAQVRGLLDDELSRDTFDRLVEYKLSGDYRVLRRCASPMREMSGLFRVPDGGVFVDLGAYNGDTVRLFSEMCPEISFVLAVEPDARNYRKLCENTRDLRVGREVEVSCVRALVSDHDGVAVIDKNKGRGVHENRAENTQKGKEKAQGQCFSGGKELELTLGESIPAATITTLLQGRVPHLIKMDVEGNERVAILGGREMIERDKPTLIVSCYHRSEDLFDLPLLIKQIVPEYRVYLRHHPHLLCWDTEFIFTL
ncbi:MAG: FkbM family methyltransferase [Clostridiales bacterium]|nr:FkbM family methyltransferase [Clostridiales bacterium]